MLNSGFISVVHAARAAGIAGRAPGRPKPARGAMCGRLDAACIAVPAGDRLGGPAFSGDRPDEGLAYHSRPRSFGSSASRSASVNSANAVTNTAMKAVTAASCHQ